MTEIRTVFLSSLKYRKASQHFTGLSFLSFFLQAAIYRESVYGHILQALPGQLPKDYEEIRAQRSKCWLATID